MPTYNDCVHFMVCDRCPNCKPDDCEFFQNKADVAEVVRCKGCEYCPDIGTKTKGMVWCRKFRTEVHPNGFCSYGERKPPEDKP